MTMLVTQDPILAKMQKRVEPFGIKTEIITERKLDFEYDFWDVILIENIDGVGSIDTIKLQNHPIDYLHIIKKQKFEKCDYAVGSFAGMGIHLHSWYKIRYILCFPDLLNIGPINIGTVTTIKKGLIHSAVEEYFWNGYPKLTTLPPGLIRDNLVTRLDSDQVLRQLLMKNLLRERIITVSRYTPPEEACKKNAIVTNAAMIIESQWKYQKDVFTDKSTFEMYSKIAEITKKAINELKYHLK